MSSLAVWGSGHAALYLLSMHWRVVFLAWPVERQPTQQMWSNARPPLENIANKYNLKYSWKCQAPRELKNGFYVNIASTWTRERMSIILYHQRITKWLRTTINLDCVLSTNHGKQLIPVYRVNGSLEKGKAERVLSSNDFSLQLYRVIVVVYTRGMSAICEEAHFSKWHHFATIARVRVKCNLCFFHYCSFSWSDCYRPC